MFDPPTTLRDRLRGALAQPAGGRAAIRGEAVTELADLSGLKGTWFSTPAGQGYVIDSWYDAGHTHGSIALRAALAVDTSRLGQQAKDPRLGGCEPGDFLYIDTETTGLGGAGAMVFLAGVARFEGTVLRLRQFLLPSPSYEAGLLSGLGDELDAARALVSFNGKSFDLPALEARAILARRRPSWRDLPHLDLLHPNRRLFRGAFAAHRLVHLEAGLLGFEREDDCPSAEVPLRYFEFQRSGDPTWIQPVLRHNAWDILSLVALVAHLGAVCDGHAGALQGGRAAEYAGDWETAARHFLDAFATATRRPERLEAAERAARALARLGRFEEAASAWQAVVGDERHRRLLPFVELAKLLEHRLHDPGRAKAIVDRALALVERGHARPGRAGSITGYAALRHRRDRLVRRLAQDA